MDTGYVNQVGLSPATASWIYQHEHPRSNHVGPIHYAGSGHYRSPDPYEPMTIFPYSGGYMTNFQNSYSYGTLMTYTTSMPYVQQFRYLQHPSFYRDFLRFEDSVPMAHTPSVFVGNLIGGVNQPGSFQSPEWSDYHLCPRYDMGDWSRTRVNNGIIYGIYPRASSNQFNFSPISNNASQHYYPLQNHRIIRNVRGDYGDASYINEDIYISFQGSIAAPEAFTPRLTGLPNTTNELRLSNEGPSCNPDVYIPKRRHYPQQQNGYKNKFRNFPTKSSMVSPAVRASGSNRWAKKSGKSQRSEPTRLSQDHLPPGESSGTHKISAPKDPKSSVKRSGIIQNTSAPHQVWVRKTETEPSASPSEDYESSSEHDTRNFQPSGNQSEDFESSSEHDTPNFQPSGNLYEDFESSSEPDTPNLHITWDGFDEGFDEPCKPVEQDCNLCHEDLSYVPTDYESEDYDFEPPNILPEVAILPCGHAFHSNCLQIVTPEEKSRDPPCYLCSNNDL